MHYRPQYVQKYQYIHRYIWRETVPLIALFHTDSEEKLKNQDLRSNRRPIHRT